MTFSRGKIKDFYLLTTDVENMFINEYLPEAPGEYVKVYLYGLLYAQLGTEMTHGAMAAQLGLSEKTLADAWSYWEQMGVVKKMPTGTGLMDFDIEYVNLRERMYGNFSAAEISGGENSSPLHNSDIKALFDDIERIMGRTLSSQENAEIASWINQQDATTELVRIAFEYCCERGKANVKYVGKVVLQWNSQGLKRENEIREYIKNLDERQSI